MIRRKLQGDCGCNHPSEQENNDAMLTTATNSLLLRRLSLQRSKPAVLAKTLLSPVQETLTRSVTRSASLAPAIAPAKIAIISPVIASAGQTVKASPVSMLPMQTTTVAKTDNVVKTANPELEEMLKTESGTIPSALLPAGSEVVTAGIGTDLPSIPLAVWGIAAAIGAYALFSGKEEKKSPSKPKGLSGVKKNRSPKPGVRTKTKNTRGSTTKGKAAKTPKKSGRVRVINL